MLKGQKNTDKEQASEGNHTAMRKQNLASLHVLSGVWTSHGNRDRVNQVIMSEPLNTHTLQCQAKEHKLTNAKIALCCCSRLFPFFLMIFGKGLIYVYMNNSNKARLYRQWRKIVFYSATNSLGGNAWRYLAPFGRHFDFWWRQLSFPWR